MSVAAPLKERPPHLPALTGIRGLAAWMVVVYHARLSLTDWMPSGIVALFGYGYLAVDLFFMLSGFVMWLNYAPRLAASGMAGAPDFWWRRAARIWPLHMAVLLAMIAFALLLVATGRSTQGYPFAELPLHVLLLQNWGFTDGLSWNHPAWSISTELGAYLLFPFLVLGIAWGRIRTPVLVAIIAGAALLIFAVFDFFGAARLGDEIPRLGLLRCLLQFVMGMVLAQLWSRWREVHTHAATTAIIGAMLLGGWIASGWGETLLVPLGFAALLLALALSTGPLAKFLGNRALEWLGDISYASYLIHFPLFILAKIVLAGDDLQVGPLGFIGYALVLLLLSHAAYRWLEKPAQRALNGAVPWNRRGTVLAE